VSWLDERPEPCCDVFVPAIERQPDTTPIYVPPVAVQAIDRRAVHQRLLSHQEYAEQRCRECWP
jgi:hypothetical protein